MYFTNETKRPANETRHHTISQEKLNWTMNETKRVDDAQAELLNPFAAFRSTSHGFYPTRG